MPKLAVLLPSRGLMFSETFEELLGELEDFEHEIYWAHGRPLPECFNEPVERILSDPDVYAVLIVEDDMIIPKGILKRMFKQNYPVVALDYPFRQNGDSTVLNDKNGYAYFTGTGFVLVSTAVLNNMPKPIFRTDRCWDTMIKGGRLYFWPRELHEVAYGMHDVNFGITLYSQGVPIKIMGKTAGQRKLREYDWTDQDHDIELLTKVGRNMVIKAMTVKTADVYKRALENINSVEIMDHVPDFITYKDGYAEYIGGGDVTYV